MYTPEPKVEKAKHRKQWREGMNQDFPRILQASKLLQEALGITPARCYQRPVLQPWELPEAIGKEFALDDSATTLIGSNEDGWAVPGASDLENLVVGYEDQPEGEESILHQEAESDESDIDGNEVDENDINIDDYNNFKSTPSDNSNKSSNTTWQEDACAQSSPSTPAISESPVKLVMRSMAFQTPENNSRECTISTTSTSVPALEFVTSPASPNEQSHPIDMLKHIFVNHIHPWFPLPINTLLKHQLPAQGQVALDPNRSTLGSPFKYGQDCECKDTAITEEYQHELPQATLETSPDRRASPPLRRHAVAINQMGDLSTSITLDLEALCLGEVSVKGPISMASPGRAAAQQCKWNHDVKPQLQWNASTFRPPKRPGPAYWRSCLHQDINHWLQCDDTEVAWTEATAITLGSLSLPRENVLVAAHCNGAERIQLIQMRLPERAYGSFAQTRILDWTIIEISWRSPRSVNLAMAFPTGCITAIDDHSDAIVWKLLQQGSVPPMFGVGISPDAVQQFMIACALGDAVVRWKPVGGNRS